MKKIFFIQFFECPCYFNVIKTLPLDCLVMLDVIEYLDMNEFVNGLDEKRSTFPCLRSMLFKFVIG